MVAEHCEHAALTTVFCMSVVAFRTVNAVAFQLAASLDEYEEVVGRLWEEGIGSELYVRVSECMDSIQRLAASIPKLSVPAVGLLIAHAEFTYALWHRARTGLGGGQGLEVSAQEHRASIEVLSRACKRQICVER